MEHGRPSFPPAYTWPVVLRVSAHSTRLSSTRLSRAMARLSRLVQLDLWMLNADPTTLTLSPEKVWAPPPSLAATNGIIGLFSSPTGTKMFQFPAFTCVGLCIQPTMPDKIRRVSPFGYQRINSRLADPRCFSQPSTSFVISKCLGIPRVPLSASPLFVSSALPIRARLLRLRRSAYRKYAFAPRLAYEPASKPPTQLR